jgi:hypothetical protein
MTHYPVEQNRYVRSITATGAHDAEVTGLESFVESGNATAAIGHNISFIGTQSQRPRFISRVGGVGPDATAPRAMVCSNAPPEVAGDRAPRLAARRMGGHPPAGNPPAS